MMRCTHKSKRTLKLLGAWGLEWEDRKNQPEYHPQPGGGMLVVWPDGLKVHFVRWPPPKIL